MASALCACGSVRQRQTAGSNASFPGRVYFSCASCDSWTWEDTIGAQYAAAGPLCKCNKASVQRAVTATNNPNKGKKFWCCAAGKPPGGCGFFQFQEPAAARSPAPARSPAAPKVPLPGFANHMQDWSTLGALQKMMQTDPAELGRGRDVREAGKYDTLKVAAAWKITNPVRRQQFEAARARVASAQPPSTVTLPADYAAAVASLNAGLDARAGEQILLHGTTPEHLHAILFEGLDPSVSGNGLFGRGTYFAEDAGKIDQYATLDPSYAKEGQQLASLHEKLYTGGTLHPKDVCYMLVCRVALGTSVHTKDGKNQLPADDASDTPARPLFADAERSVLAPSADGSTPDSLVAERGGRVERFREFVCFSGDQIIVEYLVAYKRTRSLCTCGLAATERTVVQGENRGRKIFWCHHPQGHPDKCDYMRMEPFCKCGRSAKIDITRSGANEGRKRYVCGHSGDRRYQWCKDWIGWADGIGSSAGAGSSSSFGSPSKYSPGKKRRY